MHTILAILTILGLAFAQNVSFSIVSRSRNRNNLTYHLLAATASNTIWFLTFRQLVQANMTWVLFVPYTVGTVTGSLAGVKISMWIESWLKADSDSHIKKANPMEDRLCNLEKKMEAVLTESAASEAKDDFAGYFKTS